ncbi:hypothetical protein ASD67_12620 [Sphingopyxis sp. Root1497]|nr:hypothetical protein ASD67_12620 [Sphingopyxis sp. Root1497]
MDWLAAIALLVFAIFWFWQGARAFRTRQAWNRRDMRWENVPHGSRSYWVDVVFCALMGSLVSVGAVVAVMRI